MQKSKDGTKVKMDIQDQKQSESLTNDSKFTKVNKVGGWIKTKKQGKRIESLLIFCYIFSLITFNFVHAYLYRKKKS